MNQGGGVWKRLVCAFSDMEVTQRPMSASREGANEVDYAKLVQLFTGRSSELYDRHVGVVERVCRVNANGFVRATSHIVHY